MVYSYAVQVVMGTKKYKGVTSLTFKGGCATKFIISQI